MDPSSQSEPSPGEAPTRPPSAASGRTFHHYEVCLREDGTTLHELGRGAMGVTYRARDTNLDMPVAIKVIRADLPSQVIARGRFRREARAAAQLHHANVASVFHFGELPTGECFYAMEFIDGETLADRVQREGPFAVEDALEIALQVTAALIAASERGLVHRDLKPANIMLARRDPPPRHGTGGFHHQRLTVKVIDFGLAKATAPAQNPQDHEEPLTQMGGFLGTPAYASPEQAEGGEVDARSDIYSLGVILWYLLTGKVPFTGRSFSEIYARQLRRTLPLAQLADARVSAPLTLLLTSMLSADPRKRPSSPTALYEELERCRETLDLDPATTARARRQPAGPRTRPMAPAAFAVVAVLLLAGLGAAAVRAHRRAAVAPAPPPAAAVSGTSLAVLPLENLSGDPADAYFADGIQDDLLSSLARIGGLKVISRSSVMAYRDVTTRNLREISQQLGVTTILEGSVRRAPDRVLVNVALIDTHTGLQLWTERYDRTLADALNLQGEVATEIAAALSVALSPEEKTRVEAKLTDNADAYMLYLRARDFQTRPFTLLQDLQTAESLYRQALALDPGFALAHARLAATLAFHHLTFEPTAAIRDQARAEADEALRLRPDSGEGHFARALCLYWTEKNYAAALSELDAAAHLLPGSAETELMSGAIRRRQGHWTQALASMRRALTHDPRSAQTAREILYTVCMLRDWPAAARDAERAAALAPGNPMIQVEKGHVDYWSGRNLEPLRAALAAAPADPDPDGQLALARWDAALLARDFAGAERAVAASARAGVVTTFGAMLPKAYLLGCVALARGDGARAKSLFEDARPALETEARNYPADPFRQAYLGLLYAYLGRKEDALRQGNLAVEILPEAKDAVAGPIPAGLLALIYVHTGETERALALVKHLLQTPAALSPVFDGCITQSDLRVRWQWDPLRADPRFRALLDGPELKTIYK